MNWIPWRVVFEPDFGVKLNKVDVEFDAETPLEPSPLTIPTEPVVSSNALVAPADATAKTARAGEINCPVITCGI